MSNLSNCTTQKEQEGINTVKDLAIKETQMFDGVEQDSEEINKIEKTNLSKLQYTLAVIFLIYKPFLPVSIAHYQVHLASLRKNLPLKTLLQISLNHEKVIFFY